MKKFFRNETFLKVTSVVIAVLLWMFVISIKNPQIELTFHAVPVKIEGVDHLTAVGMEIISMSERTVDVKVSGRRSAVTQVVTENISVSVDVSGVEEANTYVLPVDVSIDNDNVAISGINQREIQVVIDYVVNVARPVSVKIDGTPKEGYMTDTPVAAMTEITVLGPQTVVDSIDHVELHADVAGASKNVTVNAPVTLVRQDGSVIEDMTNLKLSSYDVSVTVIYAYKTVNIQPSFSGEFDLEQMGLTMRLDPQTVTIYGNTEDLENINYIGTQPIIFDEGLIGAENESAVALEIPANVRTVGDVQQVGIIFEEKAAEE